MNGDGGLKADQRRALADPKSTGIFDRSSRRGEDGFFYVILDKVDNISGVGSRTEDFGNAVGFEHWNIFLWNDPAANDKDV